MKKQVAILGTGALGASLAEFLLENNYEVFVYNRTTSKTGPLRVKGAIVSTPEEAVRKSSVIINTLFDADAVEKVLFSEAVKKELNGKTIINISSTTSDDARRISGKLNDLDCGFLDTVLLSGAEEVRKGQSHTVVSGPENVFNTCNDILKTFSPNLRYVSAAVGHASSIEIAVGQILLFQTASYGLALAIAKQDNVPIQAMVDTLDQSPLIKTLFFPYYAGTMGSRHYENPVWKVGNMAKSVRMFARHLKEAGVGTEMFQPIVNMTETLVKNGLEDKNFTALYETLIAADKFVPEFEEAVN